MTNRKIIGTLITILVLGAIAWLIFYKSPTVSIASFDECVAAGYPVIETYPEQCKTPDGKTFTKSTSGDVSDLIHVTKPLKNAVITSPVTVEGEARGNWYFEASFPVRILDGFGRELAVQPMQAEGEWMTTEFVPFKGTIAFNTPTTATGTIIFHKDNPSGLPQNDRELRIPVRFGTTLPTTGTPTATKNASFGLAVTLKVGERAKYSDGLMLALREINDSRCAAGVICIWQGELSSSLEASGGGFGTFSNFLRLGTVTKNQLTQNGYTIKLSNAATTTTTIVVTKP